MRDLEIHPYSRDERRIAQYFFDRGVGGGDDPIGFVLASYATLVEERNRLKAELEASRHEVCLMRDLGADPYSKCEERVADFCAARGIDWGRDDPVGFVLDSFALALEQRMILKEALRLAREDLSEALTEIDRELSMADHPLDAAILHSP